MWGRSVGSVRRGAESPTVLTPDEAQPVTWRIMSPGGEGEMAILNGVVHYEFVRFGSLVVWSEPAVGDLESAVEFIAKDSEAYAWQRCAAGCRCCGIAG